MSKRTWFVAALVLGFGAPIFADSSNPQTEASDRNFDTNQPNSVPGGMQKTKDGANRALDGVDHATHKVVHKTRHGMHKAHAKMHNAKEDMKEDAREAKDNVTAPAIKPEAVPPAAPAN